MTTDCICGHDYDFHAYFTSCTYCLCKRFRLPWRERFYDWLGL